MVVEPTLAAALEPFNLEPLGFLDCETIMRAVTVRDGTRPWELQPEVRAPALVPELSYNDLVIVDGRVASVEIVRLLCVADGIPKNERDRVRQDLLSYCERD